MRNQQIRVLIADDETHIRQVISQIVAALGGLVVAEVGDGEQAVRMFEVTRPDIVILDINMPSLTGDQALARILALNPRVIGIMMTAQDTIEAVRGCLDLGARDYILKSNPAAEIYRLMSANWADYVNEIHAADAP
ncbi:MAG TPA: response regulator transcription factor [Usitatibacter sp.]|nr:response regulator transcription factor [Usitatibacter sp.]